MNLQIGYPFANREETLIKGSGAVERAADRNGDYCVECDHGDSGSEKGPRIHAVHLLESAPRAPADALPVFFYVSQDEGPSQSFVKYIAVKPDGEKIDYVNNTSDAKYFYAKVVPIKDLPIFPK